jgi:hypothetical protein
VFVVSDICRPVEYFCMFVALGVLLQRIVRHASHSYYTQARHHVDGGWELRDCIGECVLYPPCGTWLLPLYTAWCVCVFTSFVIIAASGTHWRNGIAHLQWRPLF